MGHNTGLHPDDAATLALAQVPDERLLADLRTALVAIGWWAEVWWEQVRPRAQRYDLKRMEQIETMRDQVTSLGGSAAFDDLAQAVRPLLGEYWPSNGEGAAGLAAAVELARDVTMHRMPHVRRAREFVAQWHNRT